MSKQGLHIQHIYRYPMKGLPGENLSRATVKKDGCLPHDRRYGIVHASSKVDVQCPAWASKKHFLNLARDEKLGELSARFSEDGQKISLLRHGNEIVAGDLSTPQGRMVLEGFLSSFMPTGARGHARITDFGHDHCADNENAYLSLINLATVTDIERVVRIPLDHRRFRGNLYLSGARPWQENQWIGKTLRIGDLECEAVEKIERCNAINVEPETGKVDCNIPLSLQRGFRHGNCGIFLRVLDGGALKLGDSVEITNNA